MTPSSIAAPGFGRLPRAASATVTVAVAAAVGLTGCAAPGPPERPEGPVVLSAPPGSGTASTPTAPATRPAPTGATPVAPDVRDTGADLDADDQSGAGDRVTVDEVRLTAASGHVAVFDSRTGELLGSTPVAPGTSRGVVVPLRPPLARSGDLVLVLRADDGDGVFDAARDAAVTDDDDEAVDEDVRYTLW